MENKLEQLLDSLIEKGWKPFGTLGNVRNSVYTNKYFFFEGCADGVTLRQIVSKESGLWQFVCENGMAKMKEGYYWQNIALIHSEEYDYCDYQYRLIESSLKDESGLEQFLLDSIKVEGNLQN